MVKTSQKKASADNSPQPKSSAKAREFPLQQRGSGRVPSNSKACISPKLQPKHARAQASGTCYQCRYCPRSFRRPKWAKRHETQKHPQEHTAVAELGSHIEEVSPTNAQDFIDVIVLRPSTQDIIELLENECSGGWMLFIDGIEIDNF